MGWGGKIAIEIAIVIEGRPENTGDYLEIRKGKAPVCFLKRATPWRDLRAMRVRSPAIPAGTASRIVSPPV